MESATPPGSAERGRRSEVRDEPTTVVDDEGAPPVEPAGGPATTPSPDEATAGTPGDTAGDLGPTVSDEPDPAWPPPRTPPIPLPVVPPSAAAAAPASTRPAGARPPATAERRSRRRWEDVEAPRRPLSPAEKARLDARRAVPKVTIWDRLRAAVGLGTIAVVLGLGVAGVVGLVVLAAFTILRSL